MTYAQRVLDYLRSVAPDGATNALVARRLGIRSQQTIYMLTQQLMATGRTFGERARATLVFHAGEGPATGPAMGPESARLLPEQPAASGRFAREV